MADITGLAELERTLQNLRRVAPSACRVALQKCGAFAMREAQENCPVSPTMKQLSATLKRKKRTSQKTTPGNLKLSIAFDVSPDGMATSVFIPQNALCVSKKGFNYAKRIHDEKGRTWQKRGPGTVAKGARADEKFIERAIKDNVGKYTAIVEAALQKELGRI